MPTHLLILLLSCLVPISTAEINGTETKPLCQSKCGDITIPYPFGIGRNCSIDSWADVYCNTTFNPPKPFIIREHEVVEILQSEVRIKTNVATSCYDQSGSLISEVSSSINLEGTPYTLSSTKNKVTVLGCDTVGRTSGTTVNNYLGGCYALCANKEAIVDGKCLGTGCCQESLLPGVKEFHALADSLDNYTTVSAFDTCGSAFLVEQDMYTFKISDIMNTTLLSDLPIVLNFAIGGNQTCKEAQLDSATFQCKNNSYCQDSVDGSGYLCICNETYTGNPYLNPGCQGGNQTCKEAQLDSATFQCKNNSYCQDSVDGSGYLCICNETYTGNPYLNPGCQVRRNQTCKEAQNTTTFSCKNDSRCSDSDDGSGYLCYCIGGYKGNPYIEGGCTGNARLAAVIVPSVVGVFVVVALGIAIFYCLRRKTTKNSKKLETFLKIHGSLACKRYKYHDVKKMTSSFQAELGHGGFGSVFKGKLPDGRPVAVKLLNETKGGGDDFINEVASISKTSHVNVVTLLGFCNEGHKRALIYEFVPNGSLEKFIYAESPTETHSHLGWSMLLKIATGIARGLEYLHRGCHTRILHFDIKPHNILLEQDFTPKISDFGLAKLCVGKESIISMTGARGTTGYIAPELDSRNISGVSHKADVYSYGMMMLEMVGGRKNLDVGVSNISEIYFPLWIYTRLDLNEDLRLHGITSTEEEIIARKMILVGLSCIQFDPSNRPPMSRVLEMLEGTIDALQLPPKPSFSSPTREQGSLSDHCI